MDLLHSDAHLHADEIIPNEDFMSTYMLHDQFRSSVYMSRCIYSEWALLQPGDLHRLTKTS